MKTYSKLVLAFLLLILIVPQVGGDEEQSRISLRQIANKYSLRIEITSKEFQIRTTTGLITGSPASKMELIPYAKLFAFEFSLYPVHVVKKSRLKAVVLCANLSFNGQVRSAVPDFDHNLLFLDVALGRGSQSYFRKVIHHEFFHIIDLRDDGRLYKDHLWASLNPKGFSYGSGGINAQNDPSVSVINKTMPGFLNKYSTTGVEEDKAEIFANLIVDYGLLEELASRDRVIAIKVARMMNLLKNYSPSIDNVFWNRIRDLERPEIK